MASSHDLGSRGFWGRSSSSNSSQKRRRAHRELSASALLTAAAVGITSAGASQPGITRLTGGDPSWLSSTAQQRFGVSVVVCHVYVLSGCVRSRATHKIRVGNDDNSDLKCTSAVADQWVGDSSTYVIHPSSIKQTYKCHSGKQLLGIFWVRQTWCVTCYLWKPGFAGIAADAWKTGGIVTFAVGGGLPNVLPSLRNITYYIQRHWI